MMDISRIKLPIVILLLAVLSGFCCSDDDDEIFNPDNNPPVIESITAEPDTFVENSMTVIMVSATDPDSDALTYSWLFRESWMVPIGGADHIRQLSNCCDITELRNGFVVVDVDDGRGGKVRDSVQIWIEPAGL